MHDYTAAQRAIACLDEPLQIIACAGSGKTQVISQRIAPFSRAARRRAAQRHRVHLHREGRSRAEGTAPLDLRRRGVGNRDWPRCTSARCTATRWISFSGLCRRPSSFGPDRDHDPDVHRPEQPEVWAHRVPDDFRGTPRLRRFLHSRLYMQATTCCERTRSTRPGSRTAFLVSSGTTWSFCTDTRTSTSLR